MKKVNPARRVLALLKWSLIECSLLMAQWVHADVPFVLVSDIDDTVKITHVGKPKDAIRNGLYGQDTFLGMSELYQELGDGAKSVIYLSASPQKLKSRIKKMFQLHGFPMGEFHLRDWVGDWLNGDSSSDFKFQELNKIFALNQDSSFILVGDDTENDAFTYLAFRQAQLSSANVAKIYIHQVTGRVLPPGVTPFVTAFDFALHEVEAGRLSPESAIKVGRKIANTLRMDLVFPPFKECPEDFLIQMGPPEKFNLGPVASSNTDLIGTAYMVTARVRNYCKARRTGSEKYF